MRELGARGEAKESRLAGQRMKRAQVLSVRTITVGAIAAGSAGAILAIANINSPVRAPLVLGFLLVAPAAAIAGLLGRFDGLARLVIAGTAAVVINLLVAETMLAAGLWSPRGSVAVVAVITAVCASAQVARVRVALARALAAARRAVGSLAAPGSGVARPPGAPVMVEAPTTPLAGPELGRSEERWDGPDVVDERQSRQGRPEDTGGSQPVTLADARRGQPAPPRFSVVICAHTEKRWDETLAAVESVRGQSYPCHEIIVVVDHNPGLHAQLASALPDVTVIENREQRGLSGGKNTGVAQAQGDVVAFLDDDAVADRDWLKYFADSYSQPEVAGVGGLTLPWWETRRPAWFPGEFDWVIGCTYIGMPQTRAPVRNLLGGNASFRRGVFDLAGGFQNGIGRSFSKRPLGCEETEFCIRLSQRSPDAVMLFDNRAVIWHLIPAARGRFAYFRSRCYAEGLSKALVTASVGVGDGLSSERRYATRVLPRGMARGMTDLLRGDISGAGRAGAIAVGLAATAAGYSAGSLRRHARRRPPSSSARTGSTA